MNQFKEYVTSGAFHLSLSKVQIEMLSQIDQYGGSWGLLTTCSALIAKGLVTRTSDAECVAACGVHLTEAGKAVIPLLKLAGLYVELPYREPTAEIPDMAQPRRDREPA